MKQFFKTLFDDNNSINEKAVVGFIAFFMLVIALAVDLITGYMGNHLVINEFIFDGFMVIVLGAFGIASVDKWMNHKKSSKVQDSSEPTNEENK
jgi:membrane-anchored glycerophosphoryl diester phosphodiesterase (GDPDase)